MSLTKSTEAVREFWFCGLAVSAAGLLGRGSGGGTRKCWIRIALLALPSKWRLQSSHLDWGCFEYSADLNHNSSLSSSRKQHGPPLSGWPELAAGFSTDTGHVACLESLQRLGNCGPDPEVRSVHLWVFKDWNNNHGHLRGGFPYFVSFASRTFALDSKMENTMEGSLKDDLDLNAIVNGETATKYGNRMMNQALCFGIGTFQNEPAPVLKFTCCLGDCIVWCSA